LSAYDTEVHVTESTLAIDANSFWTHDYP